MNNASPLLDCSGVTVRFGGVMALDQVDFSAKQGAITAIIGPNGAGKTTLLNAISGMVPMAGGSILFQDRDMTGRPPHKRGGAGIVRTFQNLEIFSNMNVLENVMTGSHRRNRYSVVHALLKTPRYYRSERQCRDLALEKLAFVGLEAKHKLPAVELPFGNQRLLEIARAIAAEPDLLLLDEPAAGLNMRETRTLGRLIRRIREELGITIVLVEHDMDLVMDISDHITVLNFGRVLTKGTPQEVQRDPEVVAAYLGSDDDDFGLDQGDAPEVQGQEEQGDRP